MAKTTQQQSLNSTNKGIGVSQPPKNHLMPHCGATRYPWLHITKVGCVVAVVAPAFGVGLCDIGAQSRSCARIALARQVAMYLSHIVFGFNFTEIGRHFARDRTTAAYASRLIEDHRDDGRFDLILDHLEAAICKMDNWAGAFEARVQ